MRHIDVHSPFRMFERILHFLSPYLRPFPAWPVFSSSGPFKITQPPDDPFIPSMPFFLLSSSLLSSLQVHSGGSVLLLGPRGLWPPPGRREGGLVRFSSVCAPRHVEDDAQHWWWDPNSGVMHASTHTHTPSGRQSNNCVWGCSHCKMIDKMFNIHTTFFAI